MPVEIQLVGSSSRWLLERSPIRIGRSPDCEVELPANAYPEVSREHARLEWNSAGVRLLDRQSGNGTFVNGQRVTDATLAAGDTIRLGPDGPQLLVRLMTAAAREESTMRVAPAVAAGEENQTMRVPAAAPKPARGDAPTMQQARPAVPQAPSAPVTPKPAAEKPPAPAVTETSARLAGETAMLEQKLAGLRKLLMLTLALGVLLAVLLVYVAGQLSDTRTDLARMRGEAAAAIKQAAPTLQSDQQKLEGMDSRLAAQEKAAEDHFVQRMDQELPNMIDRYMDAKAKQLGLPKPPGGR